MSILATHASLEASQKVLEAFQESYRTDQQDTYYQSIPALTDWVLLLQRSPLEFGCLWQFDADKQPWLPTVHNFGSVNVRRERYGIGPLRWPKSMAIPEAEQPWLQRPFSEMIMRDMTDDEDRELAQDYL